MIKTYKDLRFYVEEDRKRNIGQISLIRYLWLLYVGNEQACAYRYLYNLRHSEYHKNQKNFFHYICFVFWHIRLRQLGAKYSIEIPLNISGYGLRIMHLSGGGGVHLSAESIGNYCGFNSGTLIGNNGIGLNKPVIGDYTAFAPGAKAYGGITIGRNVFVASNAVVLSDFPDDVIIGGIPAKVLKKK